MKDDLTFMFFVAISIVFGVMAIFVSVMIWVIS